MYVVNGEIRIPSTWTKRDGAKGEFWLYNEDETIVLHTDRIHPMDYGFYERIMQSGIAQDFTFDDGNI